MSLAPLRDGPRAGVRNGRCCTCRLALVSAVSVRALYRRHHPIEITYFLSLALLKGGFFWLERDTCEGTPVTRP